MSLDTPAVPIAQQFSSTFPNRFWSKVDKNGPVPVACPELGPCWIWTAAKNIHGYGVIQRGIGHQSVIQSNIASWLLHFGPIPPETPCVLHYCDNPACVRPTHLWLGTKKQNTQDMLVKGRMRGGKPIGKFSKLSAEQKREIREAYPSQTHAALAQIYGVGETTIRRIINERR